MATLENLLSKMVEKINNKVSTSEQTLTNEQQEQARLNINALSQEQVLYQIDEKEIVINYDPSLISFSFDLEEGMTFSKISNDTFTPDEFQGGIFVNGGQEITLTKDLLNIETELEAIHTYSLGNNLGMIVCFSSYAGLDRGIYIIDLQQYDTYVKTIRYIKPSQEKIQIDLLPENGFGYMKYSPVPLFTWTGSGASPYIYPKESPVGVTDIDSLGRVAEAIPNLDKVTSFTLSFAGLVSQNISDFRIAGPQDLDGRYYTTFIDNKDDTILMLIADTEIRINSHSSMMVDENNKFEPRTFPAGIYLFAADGWYISEILGDGEAPSLIDLKYLPLFKDQNTSIKKELIFNQIISISSNEYLFDSPITLEDNQWYEIAYKGQSYVAQCTFMTMDGMSGYALGNLAFFTGDENDSNGMPFLMGTVEGMGTVLISPLVNGTVLFSVAKLSYPLIDSKYLPYSKPDWHTTDASDASYIKNKPLLINSSFTPIVENYKCKTGFHEVQLQDILSSKQLGEKYKFIYDNTEYQGMIIKRLPELGWFDSKNKQYPYEDCVYMNFFADETTQPKIGFQHGRIIAIFPDSDEHTISLYVETHEHEVDYSYFHTITPSWDLGTEKPLTDDNVLEYYQELVKLSSHLQAGQVVYGQLNGNPVQILEIFGSNDGDFFDYTIKCTNGLINYLIDAHYGDNDHYTITEEINVEAAHTFIDKNIDYIYDKIIERTEQLKNS